jgi:spermidine/putrescine transport system ATP-binding protein
VAVEERVEPSTTAEGEGSAPDVRLEGVTKRFDDVVAVDDISLEIERGSFFAMLGPSGCGKTTLLRILAGLDLPDEGTVEIGGVDAGDIPPHRRPVNTVFQSYALFPHMTVRDNVAFGLRMKKVPPAALDERVDRALGMVQIQSFADRKPAQLSGGQKQRVALARAFINEPEVLLLDEPLGALDLKLRKELQVELSALQKRLGITFVFVTHDQEEALVMSDRIAVMRAGKIEQLGEAHALYERPRNRFVGQFLGSCNLLGGNVLESDTEAVVVETAGGPLRAVRHDGDPPVGGTASFAVRPEKLALMSPYREGENIFAARVEQVVYIGSESHYRLDSPIGSLTAYVMNSLLGPAGLDVGSAVGVFVPPSALVMLED